MLELKKIYKEYIMGDFKQVALDKVNLNLEKMNLYQYWVLLVVVRLLC